MATVTKRMRFEILRRDNHACRYCGATAPEAKLVVDAVVPEALGGSHKDPANLVTACESCNSGKSATPPDAALVAEIADDALRWSQAMRVATAAALADREARVADQEAFLDSWSSWACGSGSSRAEIPLDPAWRVTVDQLRSAGLPLEILTDCVSIAMSQHKIADASCFKYMCGVAWGKLRELQEAARGSMTPLGAPPAEPASAWVPYLLGFFSAPQIERARQEAREAAARSPLPEGELRVLEHAVAAAAADIQWLHSEILNLLETLPAGIGAEAQRKARIYLYDEYGATFTRGDFVDRCLTNVICDIFDRQVRA